jgi:hypothetical protein
VDKTGNVYVAQYYASRIQKFTGEGTFITNAFCGEFSRRSGCYGAQQRI